MLPSWTDQCYFKIDLTILNKNYIILKLVKYITCRTRLTRTKHVYLFGGIDGKVTNRTKTAVRTSPCNNNTWCTFGAHKTWTYKTVKVERLFIKAEQVKNSRRSALTEAQEIRNSINFGEIMTRLLPIDWLLTGIGCIVKDDQKV